MTLVIKISALFLLIWKKDNSVNILKPKQYDDMVFL